MISNKELKDIDSRGRSIFMTGRFSLTGLCLLCLILFAGHARAQKDSIPLFTKLQLTVRGDADYHHVLNSWGCSEVQHLDNTYGLKGKYFNLEVGGNIGKHFSYYFRQRIIANPGSVKFFDNTDFLYLDYHINDQWSIRLGKDALAVGGIEYDLNPVDVFYSTYYWDNFYCFQLAASAAYKSKDGKNLVRLQVGNSPYTFYNSPFGENSLLSYNLFWNGKFGHFQTLYSVNMYQRDKQGHFMNNVALGNMLTYDKWSVYLDLLHYATSTRQLMKSFAVVCRADFNINDYWGIFVKGSYEQNMDKDEWVHMSTIGENAWNCLESAGQQYFIGGVGFQAHPKSCPDVRFHAFVADYCAINQWADNAVKSNVKSGNHPRIHHDLTANLGVTWKINFLKYLQKK